MESWYPKTTLKWQHLWYREGPLGSWLCMVGFFLRHCTGVTRGNIEGLEIVIQMLSGQPFALKGFHCLLRGGNWCLILLKEESAANLESKLCYFSSQASKIAKYVPVSRDFEWSIIYFYSCAAFMHRGKKQETIILYATFHYFYWLLSISGDSWKCWLST